MKGIKQYLKSLGIGFRTHTHPPVFTSEEAEKYYQGIKGIHAKNLFLKNKKSKTPAAYETTARFKTSFHSGSGGVCSSTTFFLVIVPFRKKANLDGLREVLEERLTFAGGDDLKRVLGITPGSVSPFALINDTEGIVTVVIDPRVWNAEDVAFHPNINTETLELKGKDFQKFISSLKNKVIVHETSV